MKEKSFICVLILNLIILLCIGVLFSTSIYAQGWVSLPPYNVLWPLWSPVLSPPDPVTGVATPVISYLDKNTFLPVEPALVWDPSLPYFYMLYNYIPSYGDPVINYFDPTAGILSVYSAFETWPPDYMLTAVDTLSGIVLVPAPLTLPTGYATLFSFDPALWLNFWIPLVNSLWQTYNGINIYLLTASEILNPLFSFAGSYI